MRASKSKPEAKLEAELKQINPDNPLNRPTPKTTGGGAGTSKPIESPTLKARKEANRALADKYCTSDGTKLTQEQVEERITEAAKLGTIAYELERPELLAATGIRAPILDAAVAEAREEEKVVPFLQPDEPWETEVNGRDLLNEIYTNIRRHVFTTKSSAMACSLWTLFTYVYDAFEYSPLLFIHSPAMRCGKTTLMKTIAGMCPKSLMLVSITPATVYRLSDKYHPTLFFDEADALDKETLLRMRGIMNAGHDKESATVPRCDENTKEVKLFSLWTPKCTARIGTEGVHATELDRSIMIPMRRMTKVEKQSITKLPKRVRAVWVDIRRRALRWANDNMAQLREANPYLPEALNDRAQNNWEGMFAIADLCGKGNFAREIAFKLSGEEGDDAQSLSGLLLGDLRDIFDEEGGQEDDKTQAPTSYLVAKLLEREDRPWKTLYRGQPLKEQGVARMLKPYRITPKRLKLDYEAQNYFQRALPSYATLGLRPQGYRVRQFAHAWNRYLPARPPKQARHTRQTEDSVGVAGHKKTRQKPDTITDTRPDTEPKTKPVRPTKATKTSAPKTTRKPLGNSQMSGVSGPNGPFRRRV